MTDQFDKDMKVAEWATGRHDKRRDYEWKILLGVWAAVLATYHVDIECPDIALGWWVLSWLAFSFFWVRGTWLANENDKRLAEYYVGLATGHPTNTNERAKIDCAKWKYWYGYLFDWARQFQILATLALVAPVAYASSQEVVKPYKAEDLNCLKSLWFGMAPFETWIGLTCAGLLLCLPIWLVCLACRKWFFQKKKRGPH